MRRALILLPLFALLGGCSALWPQPSDAYLDSLAGALAEHACPPAGLGTVFGAYDAWTGKAPLGDGYYPGIEADALLAQADAFRLAGCDEAARRSYEELLRRFSGASFRAQRARALWWLRTLPPPYPVTRSPTRAI